jgi:hypothetical protein
MYSPALILLSILLPQPLNPLTRLGQEKFGSSTGNRDEWLVSCEAIPTRSKAEE